MLSCLSGEHHLFWGKICSKNYWLLKQAVQNYRILWRIQLRKCYFLMHNILTLNVDLISWRECWRNWVKLVLAEGGGHIVVFPSQEMCLTFSNLQSVNHTLILSSTPTASFSCIYLFIYFFILFIYFFYWGCAFLSFLSHQGIKMAAR